VSSIDEDLRASRTPNENRILVRVVIRLDGPADPVTAWQAAASLSLDASDGEVVSCMQRVMSDPPFFDVSRICEQHV
jgi:hypothetical protein